MIMGAMPPRRLLLSPLAEQDIDAILDATVDRFGWTQRDKYEAKMRAVLREIVRAPYAAPARAEPELTRIVGHPSPVWSRHLGSKARHRWCYRVVEDGEREVVQVARLLHDAMEPTRHVGEGFGEMAG